MPVVMASNYDEIYSESKQALGDPDPRIVSFFSEAGGRKLRVLDVGCGQGRDALLIARLGHEVVGVDLSPRGVADLNEAAKAEDLDITGIVADIGTWRPDGSFDVLLFDRVLHMLPEPDRCTVLAQYLPSLAPGGAVLISDETPNIAAMQDVLNASGRLWSDILRQRGRLFVRATERQGDKK